MLTMTRPTTHCCDIGEAQDALHNWSTLTEWITTYLPTINPTIETDRGVAESAHRGLGAVIAQLQQFDDDILDRAAHGEHINEDAIDNGLAKAIDRANPNSDLTCHPAGSALACIGFATMLSVNLDYSTISYISDIDGEEWTTDHATTTSLIRNILDIEKLGGTITSVEIAEPHACTLNNWGA